MATAPKGRKPAPKYSDRGIPSPDYSPPWMATPGLYIAGREALDEVDSLGADMDRKWGVGRLRLLVGADLAEKFSRQKYLTAQARQTGQLEDVKREAKRMATAYRALDRAAEAAGCAKADPQVWEVVVPSGELAGAVAAIVRDESDYARVVDDGRHKLVYTLSEIGRMLSEFHIVIQTKLAFPGAIVESIGNPKDPVQPYLLPGDEGIPDVSVPLDGVDGFGDVSEPTWQPPRNMSGEIISPRTSAIDDPLPF